MPESETENDLGLPIRNIVFATDFLESSRLALDYAVAFAHHYRAKLTVVHAFELPPEAEEVEIIDRRPSVSREHALSRLDAFASGVRRLGIVTETDLRSGDPCAAVLASAVDKQADLLVLGTHGIYKGLQHLLIGSNAEKILLSAQCPTLTVGRHVMGGIDLHLNFDQILFVSDFSSGSAAAAHYAIALGRDLGIDVNLLAVLPEGEALDSDNVRGLVEGFCAELATDPVLSNHQWGSREYHLNRVVSAPEIVRRAAVSVNSLLILGVHAESRWNRHLHASFAYELVGTASCPLLSIHRR